MTENKKAVKRFRKPLRIIGVLIVLSALVLWGVFMLSRPCDRTDATYSNFVVEENDTKAQVAENLYKNGFISDASRFELLLKLSFKGNFRPGTYFLSPSQSSFEIIHALSNGLTTSQGFTIPAGLTVDQIATALDRDGIVDKKKFMKAASSKDLLQIDIIKEGIDENSNIKGSDLIEGFILPTDYRLSSDVDESMIIIMMIDAFSNFYNEDYRARAEEMGMDVRDVLAIASVIEKETSVDSERAKISAVLHNRYNLEMTDKKEIYDIPICNPSEESIIAALYPEETEDVYYVLSSELDGTHKFTSDESEYQAWLEEYNNAVKEREEAEASASEPEAESGSEAEDNAETSKN